MPIPTLEELAGQVYGPVTSPDQVPDDSAFVTQPSQVPDQAMQDGSTASVQDFQPQTVDEWNNPLPQPGGFKIGHSEAGYSPQQAAKVEAGPYGSSVIGKAERGARARAEAAYGDNRLAIRKGFEAEQAAATNQENAEAEQSHAIATAKAELATMNKDHADDILRVHQAGRAAAAKAKNDYRAQLASIPEVNPNAMWDEAGTGGQVAMGVAAFVHGMLAVKGIQTTAMDTINSAIKNKIDAQIANINNKKWVAAEFKNLYDMTVAESASDQEVRAKMYGYQLKAFEAQTDAMLAPYDSKVARAKWGVIKANLQQEQQKAVMDVDKLIEQSTQAAVNQELDYKKALLAASTQRRGQDIELQIADMKKNKDKKEPVFIFDSETGKGRWMIKPSLMGNEKVVNDVIERAGKFEPANKTIAEIRALARKMSPANDITKGTRFSPEDQRRYNGMVKAFAHQLVAARGERPTDRDVIDELTRLPTNTTLTNGGIDTILANTQMSLNDEMLGPMRQTLDDVPEQYQPEGLKTRSNEASYSDAARTRDALPATRTETLLKQAKEPFSQKEGIDPSKLQGTEAAEYELFTKPYWDDFVKTTGYKRESKYKYTADLISTDGKGEELVQKDLQSPSQAFNAVRELAEDAFHGDETAKQSLEALATNQDNLSKQDKDISQMANYFRDKIKHADLIDSDLGFSDEQKALEETTRKQPLSKNRPR